MKTNNHISRDYDYFSKCRLYIKISYSISMIPNVLDICIKRFKISELTVTNHSFKWKPTKRNMRKILIIVHTESRLATSEISLAFKYE